MCHTRLPRITQLNIAPKAYTSFLWCEPRLTTKRSVDNAYNTGSGTSTYNSSFGATPRCHSSPYECASAQPEQHPTILDSSTDTYSAR